MLDLSVSAIPSASCSPAPPSPRQREASIGVGALFGGSGLAEIIVLPSGYYPDEGGVVHSTIEHSDIGIAREHGRGTEEVSKRLSPWPGGPTRQR